MPLPADHDLSRPQMLIEDSTGTLFSACNCSKQPVMRTLRYVSTHRHEFSLPAEVKARDDATTQAKLGQA